jgi:ParB family chromosome partitioning protein
LKKELTVRQVEALVKAMKKPPKPPVEEDPDALRVDYYAEAERQMQQSVGRRVRIVRGRKTGKIEIEYCGDEDLNDLIDLLSGINARKK